MQRLPSPLLTQILRHLPLNQRLRAGLVCVAFRDAASAATTELQHTIDNADSAPGLQSWVTKHADQLVSLELSKPPVGFLAARIKLALPWKGLCRLQILILHNIEVPLIASAVAPSLQLQPGSAGSSEAGRPLLPLLKQLSLDSCRLHSVDCLLQLCGGNGLTSLTLSGWCPFHYSSSKQHGSFGAAIVSMLQRLRGLQVLHLTYENSGSVDSESIAAISAMKQLRDLRLRLGITFFNSSTSCFADLPTSLTRLELIGMQNAPIATLPPGGLPQLSKLLRMRLDRCVLLPAVLGSVAQLQHLELHECALLPREGFLDEQGVAVAALMQALAGLSSLRHLQLCSILTAEPPRSHLSALTASSHLTALVLQGIMFQPLAMGALQHILPAGRQFSQLHTLELSVAADVQVNSCVDAQDLSHIISCAPQLASLDITCVLSRGADLSSLLRLPQSCSSLLIGGSTIDDEAAALVAALTQLTSLQISYSYTLTDMGIEHLTALPPACPRVAQVAEECC